MHAIHAAILFCSVSFAAPPVVEQTVEMVAVHHLENGSELVSYLDFVQGSWTLLHHQYGFPSSGIRWDGECWQFDFHDETDSCYRVIRARCWAECWSEKDPRADEAGQPWFVGLLEPGLKSPPRAEP
jgi:hypothetical protein